VRFKNFLNEAYDYSRCKDYKGIDLNICNWIFNEIPLPWKTSDIEKCKEMYGNVNVGTVYRGAKINTEDELEMYHNAKKTGYIDLHLVSSTPEKETAKSFAFYIKSYDELTMLKMLVAAVKNGSAGKYGSVLLELEPNNDNVIFKTYREGNERKDWEPTKCAAESEVLLNGKVKVKSIEIFEPLTKENWEDVIMRSSTSLESLKNDFIKRWINENNISRDKFFELSKKIAKNVILSEEDVYFVIKNQNYIWLDKEVWLNLEVTKNFAQKYFNYDELVTKYKGVSLYLPGHFYEELLDSPKLVKDLASNVHSFDIKEKGGYYYVYSNGGIADADEKSPIHKLVRLCYLNKKLFNYIKGSVIIKNIEKKYLELFDEYMKIDEFSSKEDMETLLNFIKFLSYSFSDIYYLIKPEIVNKTLKFLMKKILTFTSHGKMDQQKRLALDYQREFLLTLNALNKVLDKF